MANAQLNELNLTQNLTGNAAADAPLIAMLNMGFMGGVQQNMKNMQDVCVALCHRMPVMMLINTAGS